MSELFNVESDELRCISLWQPWAQWVILGLKTIETRLHDRFKNLEGQRIAIHAAQKWDGDAWISAMEFMPLDGVDKNINRYECGSIIGTVRVAKTRWLNEDDSEGALIDCGNVRRFGLVLEDPLMFSVAMPETGRQGIWKVKQKGETYVDQASEPDAVISAQKETKS